MLQKHFAVVNNIPPKTQGKVTCTCPLPRLSKILEMTGHKVDTTYMSLPSTFCTLSNSAIYLLLIVNYCWNLMVNLLTLCVLQIEAELIKVTAKC